MNRPTGHAGYSGTPLVTKLGLKSGARMQLVSAPSGFGDTLGTMPDGVKLVTRGDLDFAMVFVRGKSELAWSTLKCAPSTIHGRASNSCGDSETGDIVPSRPAD